MAEQTRIAIVDDEQDMRQSISQWLALSGFATETYASAEEALKKITPDYPGVVISDIRMPGMDGMQFLKRLMSADSSLPVIMITGHGDVPMAVEAMQLGAYDFMEKPFNPDRLTDLARRAAQARKLTLDNRALRRELSDGTVLMRKLIGTSPAMERLREDILDLGQADTHVLIDGETGTGKTLVAHALHAVGPRQGKTFALTSCAALGEEALGAKLFGPVTEGGLPLVEEARGGTLVLEDIEALPLALQARLLTFINDQGTPAETRIVAIHNGSDPEKTLEDSLRPDLFFRLAAMKLVLPPLRNRGEDVLTLFTHFAESFGEEYGAVLQQRRGTGSISSLLMSDTQEQGETVQVTTEGKPLKEYVEAFERMLIDNTMRRHRGSIAGVMEELSLPRRTLNEKMAKYGLSRGNYL